jgi:hypothetical protein
MKSFDPHSLRDELSAFVDGELGSAETDRLLRHLLSDPEAIEALRRAQQLTVASRRAVRANTPPPSDALRERLRNLPSGFESPSQAPMRRLARLNIRPWWAALPRFAAALILVGIGVWFGQHWDRSKTAGISPSHEMTTAVVLPAATIAQAEEIHGFCSRLAEGLHSAGYPADLAPLSSSVENDLHSDHPYPNLSSIGYRYRGAGPCGVPLGDTVHLLYRSLKPGSVKAVSVFVQPWRGQFPLDEGRLYVVSLASSPFPMLAWRTERVVYFLLADDATTVQQAASLIRGRD